MGHKFDHYRYHAPEFQPLSVLTTTVNSFNCQILSFGSNIFGPCFEIFSNRATSLIDISHGFCILRETDVVGSHLLLQIGFWS